MLTHTIAAACLTSILAVHAADGLRLYLPLDGSVEAAISCGAIPCAVDPDAWDAKPLEKGQGTVA